MVGLTKNGIENERKQHTLLLDLMDLKMILSFG